MSEQRCTINESFMGLMLGDCGQPTMTVVTYECPARHTLLTPMCEEHFQEFMPDEERGDDGKPVFCDVCYTAANRHSECMAVGQRKPHPDAIEGLFADGKGPS